MTSGKWFLKWTAALGLATLLPLGRASAQYRGYDDWHNRMMYGWGWGMGWFGGIFMIAIWVLIIIGIVFLIRWLVHGPRGDSGGLRGGRSNAMEILRERYARGEIDKQEFEEKKRDLS